MSFTIFELWPVPLRLVKVANSTKDLPQIYQYVKKLPDASVLIEFPLPTGSNEQQMENTSRYMYFSTFHWRTLINGYSGFAPGASKELVNVLAKSPPKVVLSALRAFGIQYVLVHWEDIAPKEQDLFETFERSGDLKPLFREGKYHTLYQVNNSQYEGDPSWFPDVERFTIYESEQQPGSVTLCLYLQMEIDQFLLSSPWQNTIECEVSWYKYLGGTLDKFDTPILVKHVSFQESHLIHATSNAIAMDVPAPGTGKYQVVVRYHLGSRSVTKTATCEIHPHGFIQFQEDP